MRPTAPLRITFADLLRPLLAEQGKRGFSVPMKYWLVGALRNLAEKGSGLVSRRGASCFWQIFIRNPTRAPLVGEPNPCHDMIVISIASAWQDIVTSIQSS